MKSIIFGVLSIMTISTPVWAWTPAKVPAACGPVAEVIAEFKSDGIQPWVLSKLKTGDIELSIIIWRGKDNEIIVTTQPKGTSIMCMVADGDTDTVILDLDFTKDKEKSAL